MAKTRSADGKLITTMGDAWILAADLNGVNAVSEMLAAVDGGNNPVSHASTEWVRPILVDWLSETGGRLENQAGALRAFLEEARTRAEQG